MKFEAHSILPVAIHSEITNEDAQKERFRNNSIKLFKFESVIAYTHNTAQQHGTSIVCAYVHSFIYLFIYPVKQWSRYLNWINGYFGDFTQQMPLLSWITIRLFVSEVKWSKMKWEKHNTSSIDSIPWNSDQIQHFNFHINWKVFAPGCVCVFSMRK